MEAPVYVLQPARVAVLLAWLGGCGAFAQPRASVLPPLAVATEETPRALAVAQAEEETTAAIVLVTIDGARWQEIFEGVDAQLARRAGLAPADVVAAPVLLPNIHALIARGTAVGAPGHGEPVSASGPTFISLPGYMELFAGRKTSCVTNGCPRVRGRTLADEVRDAPAVEAEDVAVIASWATYARAATSSPARITVSAGRHGGETRDALRVDAVASALLDRAENAAPAPGDEDYRPDRFTSELALRYLTARRPRLLAVGLGDTDEHAHAGDYRSYLAALRAADAFVGDLTATLARLGAHGRATTIVVTADHGRSADFVNHGRDPESARVFLIAGGGAVPARGPVDASASHHLADVAPTLRSLLALPDVPGGGAPIRELLPTGAGDLGAREAHAFVHAEAGGPVDPAR